MIRLYVWAHPEMKDVYIVNDSPMGAHHGTEVCAFTQEIWDASAVSIKDFVERNCCAIVRDAVEITGWPGEAVS